MQWYSSPFSKCQSSLSSSAFSLATRLKSNLLSFRFLTSTLGGSFGFSDSAGGSVLPVFRNSPNISSSNSSRSVFMVGLSPSKLLRKFTRRGAAVFSTLLRRDLYTPYPVKKKFYLYIYPCPKPPSSVDVLMSWHLLHNGCQFVLSQNNFLFPLCGLMWSTTVAADTLPRLWHSAHSGCLTR